MTSFVLLLATTAFTAWAFGYLAKAVYRRGIDRWILAYLVQSKRKPEPDRTVHVLICVADHFEPRTAASDELARSRVELWVREYPARFERFRDSDGRTPRHSFFFPIEEYDPEHLDALAGLCRAGFGEVEVQLHHDNDTSDNLRRTLIEGRDNFTRHGLLARDRWSGAVAYGFVHGNWALDNSRPDRRWCGVNDELEVLRETGCYADFTLPSAPSRTQTRKINSIYYAIDDPRRPRSHDKGVDVGTGKAPAKGLMLIQGPLVLDWRRRGRALFPNTENGCIQASQPPHISRLDLWLKARVQVSTRPDWFFIKLHAHGAMEYSHDVLLGEPMVQFHEDLAELARGDPNFCYHYVTAREMYNLVKAAEDGWLGSVAEALNYHLVWDAGCQLQRAGASEKNEASCRE
jgi:hypothetical protein